MPGEITVGIGDILQNINSRLERAERRIVQAEDMLRKLKTADKRKGKGK